MRNNFFLMISIVILFTLNLEAVIIDIPSDFSTIQEGIDTAVTGDTVLVADGTYTGAGNRDISFDGKAIIVLSENGADFTIIDCEGTESEPHSGFIFNNNEASNSILQGFTVINGYGYHPDNAGVLCGGAIYLISSSPQIRDCIFDNNYSEAGGAIQCRILAMPEIVNCVFENNTSIWGSGIHAKEGSAPHINKCIFRYNIATTSGAAINLNDASPLIEDCLIYKNGALTGGAIKFYGGSDAELRNCTIVNNIGIPGSALNVQTSSPEIYNSVIAFNKNSEPVVCVDGGIPTFFCTDISDNDIADWGSCISDQLGVNGNFSADPLFCNILAENFHPLESSPCAPDNNDCGILLGSEEVTSSCDDPPPSVTIYVNHDGTGDATTIQGGVDLATSGDTVLVAAGTYTGAGNRDINFGRKEIAVFSENGADLTIIDCEGTELEPHSGFIFNNIETNISILRGFTITNGYGYHPDNAGVLCGGAIYLIASSPQIKDCIFDNNHSEAGGAIQCRVSTKSEIVNCVFENNTSIWGSGIHIKEGSAPHVSNCIFRYNTATTSGAAINLNNASPLIEYCLMHDNGALTGGAIKFYLGANAELRNCTIVNNTANPGSALNVQRSFPEIYNSVIAFNNSEPVVCVDGYPSFYCTDIYGNTGDNWSFCISDQLGVNGNISADPLFCNILTENFHLLESSPCAPDNNDCGVLMGALGAGCSAICGDCDGSGSIDLSDAIYLLLYIFADGLDPIDSSGGDIDGSGTVNITDAVYLIYYIFLGGPAPCE